MLIAALHRCTSCNAIFSGNETRPISQYSIDLAESIDLADSTSGRTNSTSGRADSTGFAVSLSFYPLRRLTSMNLVGREWTSNFSCCVCFHAVQQFMFSNLCSDLKSISAVDEAISPIHVCLDTLYLLGHSFIHRLAKLMADADRDFFLIRTRHHV